MVLGLLIGGTLTFLGLWGSLWYKMGRLTKEVEQHNLKLIEIQKALETLITRGR